MKKSATSAMRAGNFDVNLRCAFELVFPYLKSEWTTFKVMIQCKN